MDLPNTLPFMSGDALFFLTLEILTLLILSTSGLVCLLVNWGLEVLCQEDTHPQTIGEQLVLQCLVLVLSLGTVSLVCPSFYPWLLSFCVPPYLSISLLFGSWSSVWP